MLVELLSCELDDPKRIGPATLQVAIDNILGYLFDAVVEAPPIRSPTDAEPRHRFIPGRSHLDRRAAP